METIQKSTIELETILWKLIPSEEGDFLVAELRDADKREVALGLISLEHKKLVGLNKSLPVSWWISLKAISASVIVMQGFKDHSNPTPKGIYVFSLPDLGLLWQHKDRQFVQFINDGKGIEVTAEEIESNENVVANTGVAIEFDGMESIAGMESKSILHPGLYTEGSENFSMVKKFILDKFKVECIGNIEYMEFGDGIIISYYFMEGKKYSNRLLVLSQEGEVLIDELLASGAEGIGLATFFICGNRLIYSASKTSITILDIV